MIEASRPNRPKAPWQRPFTPRSADLGLSVIHPRLTYTNAASGQQDVVYDYFSISSDRMILPPAVLQAAERTFGKQGGQTVFTYLANVIEPVPQGKSPPSARLPYSMVTAIRVGPEFPLQNMQQQPIGPLADEEIVLTSWAADDLSVGPGDRVRLTYFQPESEHGASEEAHIELTVKAITPLTPPAPPDSSEAEQHYAKPPTLANDPHLTPVVKGITDQKSIDDWEVPFTIDYKLIRPQDDQYWDQYGTTPKAYVSLATGERLWGSRFGHATSYRIAASSGLTQGQVEHDLLAALSRHKAALGFAFLPIKRMQLEASQGNTPFDVLFLLLSFFIITAALLLVALLVRLGFEQRAKQAGLLLAVGWNRRRLRRLLTIEGLCIALVGSGVGVVIGLGYAVLIVAALQSKAWWLGAISRPFLEFHYSVWSLAIGYLSGALVSIVTIYWSVFHTRRIPTRQLIAGRVASAEAAYAAPARWPHLVAAALIILALILGFAATRLSGEEQAGSFVGSGTLILIALLLWVWNALRQGGQRIAPLVTRTPLVTLAGARRRAQSHPQHHDYRVDCHGQLPDCRDECVSADAHRVGHGRFRLDGHPVATDLRRPEPCRGP